MEHEKIFYRKFVETWFLKKKFKEFFVDRIYFEELIYHGCKYNPIMTMSKVKEKRKKKNLQPL